MDNMKSTITERGDHWHPDPEKDKKLGGPGANQRAREDRADAAKPKSDSKKLRPGESYMDYAKRHGRKSPTKKKSLLSKLLRKEHHQKDEDGKVIEHEDTTPSSVEEGKGYQPEIEHSKMGDAKKKAEKKRKEAEKSLPPHLKLDTMRKAFAHTNEGRLERVSEGLKQARKNVGMDPDKPSCWKGYKATGTKMKGGKKVPDCKKEEVLVVDEGIGDMAIKAIEKTNPPHISKRSEMMRKIKLNQLKSYLKKQDEKKKKAASKD